MRKKYSILMIVSVFMFISLGWIGFSLGKNLGKDDFYKKLDVFAEALVVIDQKYVTPKSPEDLIHGALEGALSSLDAYSQFLSTEAYKELLVETEGRFGGLGIEIMVIDGMLTIVSPLEGSPAWKAGIKPADIIIKIDGAITKGFTLNQAVTKLRGKPGEKVVLTVLRGRELKEITVVRDIIKIQDIKRALLLEDGIGYLKIAEFREKTPRDLDRALDRLKKGGLRGLIIDVRNNPGGLLDSALEATSRFLKDGTMIVSTRARGEIEEEYKSLPGKMKCLDIPIVVIINKGSASGSEILAAALRENNRAVLLGETTFGKGSVQTVIPLSDGSALRLTTAAYYTPWNKNIHERGVTPDIVMKDIGETDNENIFNRLEGKNEFQYKNDPLLVRALDLMKGILVLSPDKEQKITIEGPATK